MGMITFCESRFNYRFQFRKRRQLFVRSHNETLSVVAVRINNPDLLQLKQKLTKSRSYVALRISKNKITYACDVSSASAALRAAALRCSAEHFLAVAFPPLRPSAWANAAQNSFR